MRKSKRVVEARTAKREREEEERKEEEKELQAPTFPDDGWFGTREEFFACFGVDRVVDVCSHPLLPVRMQECLYAVRAGEAASERNFVLFMTLGADCSVDHMCSQKIIKKVYWADRLPFIAEEGSACAAWDSFLQGGNVHLLVRYAPKAVAAPAGDATRWKYLGEAIRVCSSASIEHIGGPHYRVDTTFSIARASNSIVEELGNPCLKCRINKYGMSLCRASQQIH